MIGTEAAAAGVDHDRAADMAAVQQLEAELTKLKAAASEKQSEINRLEKECGLDVRSKMAKKLEPITVAFNQAVEKAKPVVKSAADKVVQKANEIREKMNKNQPDDEEEPKFSGDPEKDTPAPKPVGSGNEDNPYLIRSSSSKSSSSTGNDDNPYMTKTSIDEASISTSTTPTSAEPTSIPTPSPEDEQAEAERQLEQQQKRERIVQLQEELRDEQTLIASRESEIAWLYKKHKLSQPNSFTKFRSNIQASDTYKKIGTNFGIAKEKTKWGLGVAGAKTKSLWQSAGLKASQMSLSLKEMMNKKPVESSKSSSKAPSVSTAGKDDMYARYS